MNETEKRKRVEYTSSPQQSLAYIIIGIGVVWLLVNIIGWSLWPLLLLGVGILMLTGTLRPGDIQHHHFHAPVAEAESAEVHLNLEVGETTIHALSDETALFESINQLREVVRLLRFGTQTGVRERCFYRGPNIPFLRERHRLGQASHLRWTQREILMREHLLPRGHLSRETEAPVIAWR